MDQNNPIAGIRFGVIGNPKDYDWYGDWLAKAETAGFSLVTTGDSQSLWADPFVTLGVAAAGTQSAQLAVTVSNPRTRHPAVAAGCLAALNQLAPNRVAYGIGSGDSALKNLGLRPASVNEVGDYATSVKELCAGRQAEWKETTVKLQWGAFDLPIWLAAEGPRMQHLAGEIADGVLLSNALDHSVLTRARSNIARGAESCGRSPGDVGVWCLAAMCFADSESEGIHQLRSLLAGTANHVYRFHLEGKEVPESYRAALRELNERYDYRHHASPATALANAQLVEELGLVNFLASRSVIAGTPEHCVARIRDLMSMGVDRLLVHHHANEPIEFMETFANEVRPHLRVAGAS